MRSLSLAGSAEQFHPVRCLGLRLIDHVGGRCVCLYTIRGSGLWETTPPLCGPQGTGKKEKEFIKLVSTKKIRPSWIGGTGQRRFGLCPVNPSVRGMLGTWTKQNRPFAYGSIDQGNVDIGVERPGLFCHGLIGQGNVGTCIAQPGQSAHSSIKQGNMGTSDLTKQGCLQLCK